MHTIEQSQAGIYHNNLLNEELVDKSYTYNHVYLNNSKSARTTWPGIKVFENSRLFKSAIIGSTAAVQEFKEYRI